MVWPWDLLIPDLMCESVFDVPFEAYQKKGIAAVVFDIDNTLVSYETPLPTERVAALLRELSEAGLSLALVSNNSPQRVALFNESLGCLALPDAKKPLKRALAPVLEHFSLSPREVLVVGDQLLTDVLAAKRWGMTAVAVSPIKKKENAFFRFKRFLEIPFIRWYRRRKRKEEKQ
ncbi:MAG: YqeG family HAD IIIA-type phosphatase [Clostridia bacterium]|nr:YqeG family HAD IIIA-type phosphatase [Clostridia bacterium]